LRLVRIALERDLDGVPAAIFQRHPWPPFRWLWCGNQHSRRCG
jgi:hypothetical protein